MCARNYYWMLFKLSLVELALEELLDFRLAHGNAVVTTCYYKAFFSKGHAFSIANLFLKRGLLTEVIF